jgi:chromosome segregation ATPase
MPTRASTTRKPWAQLKAAGGAVEQGEPQQRQARLAELAEAFSILRNDNHEMLCRTASRTVAAAREKCEALIETLAPWKGDIGELRAMLPPSAETIRGWKASIEELERKSLSTDEEHARLSQSLKRFEAEAGALSRSGALPSNAETETLRMARDEAWKAHRKSLGPETATVFEAAMQAYDNAADKRAAHQADVAKLNEISVQSEITRAALDSAGAARSALKQAISDLREQIATATGQLSPSLPAGMTPEALADWLARRDQVLEADETLRARLGELQAAEEGPAGRRRPFAPVACAARPRSNHRRQSRKASKPRPAPAQPRDQARGLPPHTDRTGSPACAPQAGC